MSKSDDFKLDNDNIKHYIKQYITNKFNLHNKLKGISIGDWDVTGVTDMSEAFVYKFENVDIGYLGLQQDGKNIMEAREQKKYENFNEDISKWNVSKVTNMSNMFKGLKSFNQDLSKWDVSEVEGMDKTYMNKMFEGCKILEEEKTDLDKNLLLKTMNAWEKKRMDALNKPPGGGLEPLRIGGNVDESTKGGKSKRRNGGKSKKGKRKGRKGRTQKRNKRF
jgi:surface protein